MSRPVPWLQEPGPRQCGTGRVSTGRSAAPGCEGLGRAAGSGCLLHGDGEQGQRRDDIRWWTYPVMVAMDHRDRVGRGTVPSCWENKEPNGQ